MQDTIINIAPQLLMMALTGVAGWLGGKVKGAAKEREREDAKREEERKYIIVGMRELMRSKLYSMHERYVVNGNPMPYEEKEHEEFVYQVYHGLGGNGTGTHIHQELQAAYVGGRKEHQ